MALCILSFKGIHGKGIERNEYCLDNKARAVILSWSDSAKSKRLGKTNITTRDIETQRQAFIHAFGYEF